MTTEFSGSTLAMIEIAHWYETVLLLGIGWLFFAWNPIVAVVAVVLLYVARSSSTIRTRASSGASP